MPIFDQLGFQVNDENVKSVNADWLKTDNKILLATVVHNIHVCISEIQFVIPVYNISLGASCIFVRIWVIYDKQEIAKPGILFVSQNIKLIIVWYNGFNISNIFIMIDIKLVRSFNVYIQYIFSGGNYELLLIQRKHTKFRNFCQAVSVYIKGFFVWIINQIFKPTHFFLAEKQ